MNIVDIRKAVNAGLTGVLVEDLNPEAVNAVICVKNHLTKPEWTMRTLLGLLKSIKEAGAVITPDEVALTLFVFVDVGVVRSFLREDGKIFYHFSGHFAAHCSVVDYNENVEIEETCNEDEYDNEYDNEYEDTYDDIQYPAFGEGLN